VGHILAFGGGGGDLARAGGGEAMSDLDELLRRWDEEDREEAYRG
jgi:hypothetical protein